MLLLDEKAVETATAVSERPHSKSYRFYCTVSASEVVKFTFFGTYIIYTYIYIYIIHILRTPLGRTLIGDGLSYPYE
ncbi:unnamed protein product [Brassica oleracea]